MSPDVFETIADWRGRLTGTRESSAGASLDENIEHLLCWQARKVVAEQMIALETATILLVHKVTPQDLQKALCSRDVKQKPLGRLAWLTGLQTFVKAVADTVLPLLKAGAYRPFLTLETARAILALRKVPSLPDGAFDPANVADAIYSEGLSPFAASKSLKLVAKLARQHPDAVPRLLQAVRLAAHESSGDIANLEEVDPIAQSIVEAQES